MAIALLILVLWYTMKNPLSKKGRGHSRFVNMKNPKTKSIEKSKNKRIVSVSWNPKTGEVIEEIYEDII